MTDEIRLAQAKRYWDKGFGRELNLKSFEAYLATIPADFGSGEYLMVV